MWSRYFDIFPLKILPSFPKRKSFGRNVSDTSNAFLTKIPFPPLPLKKVLEIEKEKFIEVSARYFRYSRRKFLPLRQRKSFNKTIGDIPLNASSPRSKNPSPREKSRKIPRRKFDARRRFHPQWYRPHRAASLKLVALKFTRWNTEDARCDKRVCARTRVLEIHAPCLSFRSLARGGAARRKKGRVESLVCSFVYYAVSAREWFVTGQRRAQTHSPRRLGCSPKCEIESLSTIFLGAPLFADNFESGHLKRAYTGNAAITRAVFVLRAFVVSPSPSLFPPGWGTMDDERIRPRRILRYRLTMFHV